MTETPTAAPGLFGRKPPIYDPDSHPAILFSAIAPALVPVHPLTYDPLSGWAGWQMLGNNTYGDCVAVSWATERRIKTKGRTYPTLDQVIAFYKTQNPNFPTDDGGMVIQSALEYLVKVGGPDGVKAIAFAKVDHTSIEEMRAALFLFGCLWLGVNVTAENQRQFPAQCWTRTGTVEGGHSIIGIGYLADRLRMETWAAEACLANGYVTGGTADGAGLEEAWIVVWPEDVENLTAEGRTALAANFTALTGKGITWPDTPGQFPPVPVGPVPSLAADLASALTRYTVTSGCPAYLRAAVSPPTYDGLAAALRRFVPTSACPTYLRTPAQAWLAQQ